MRSTQLKTFNSVMQEITCKLTPTVLQKNVKMQIQFLGRGWRYHSTNKAAWLCAFCKLTTHPSRRCFRLSAAKESTGIPALIRQQEPVADFSATLRCLFPPRSLQPLLRLPCGLAWCAESLDYPERTKQTQRAAAQPYLTTARAACSKS